MARYHKKTSHVFHIDMARSVEFLPDAKLVIDGRHMHVSGSMAPYIVQHGDDVQLVLACGSRINGMANRFADQSPILFDTWCRTKDTAWENYAQFWFTTINTVQHSAQRGHLFAHHTDTIKMTGFCLEGPLTMTAQSLWKVRVFTFHCKAPTDNEFSYSNWLFRDDRPPEPVPGNMYEHPSKGFDHSPRWQNIPVGMETAVTPCEEIEMDSVEGTWTVYLPWEDWVHPTAYLNQTRQVKLMKGWPRMKQGFHAIKPLNDKMYTFRNNSNKTKTV